MNALTVAKFGGTSLADFQAMCRCAEIIIKDPAIRVVVVSASSGVTNLLVQLASGSLGQAERAEALAKISDIQQQIIQQLEPGDVIERQVAALLESIERLAEQQAENPTPVTTDELLSHGERLSSLLFTELLAQRGQPSECLDVRRVLRTDSHHGKAEPQLEAIASLVDEYLAPRCASQVVVTQGFIGADADGTTTTLGRGGSDYTAALLGEALAAQCIQIWTDVTGIFTTDPRITDQARALTEVSFSEAAELATFGAKVLHPSTLIPAMRHDIPVFVGSSREPDKGGTLVRNQAENSPTYRAVALRRQQTLVTVTSMAMLQAPGFLMRVFEILARHRLSVDLVTTSEVSVALTLDNAGSDTSGRELLSPALLAELEEICEVSIETDLALVALIGNNIDQCRGVGNSLFAALDDINVRLICHGASSHNLCFLVAGDQASTAVTRIHRQLFEQTDPQSTLSEAG